MFVAVIGFLVKQHLSSGREQEFVSVQSFKRQKEGSSTGRRTDRNKRRVHSFTAHGADARTVQQWK